MYFLFGEGSSFSAYKRPSGRRAQNEYFVYDAQQRLVYQINSQGYVTQFQYNGLSQLAQQQLLGREAYPVSSGVTQTDLDSWWTQQLNAIDSNNEAVAIELSQFQYDVRGQLIEQRQYSQTTLSKVGNVWQLTGTGTAYRQDFIYDAQGRLLSSTDASGNRQLFYYDGLNRLTAQVDALGNQSSFHYFNDTRKVTATNADELHSWALVTQRHM